MCHWWLSDRCTPVSECPHTPGVFSCFPPESSCYLWAMWIQLHRHPLKTNSFSSNFCRFDIINLCLQRSLDSVPFFWPSRCGLQAMNASLHVVSHVIKNRSRILHDQECRHVSFHCFLNEEPSSSKFPCLIWNLLCSVRFHHGTFVFFIFTEVCRTPTSAYCL